MPCPVSGHGLQVSRCVNTSEYGRTEYGGLPVKYSILRNTLYLRYLTVIMPADSFGKLCIWLLP